MQCVTVLSDCDSKAFNYLASLAHHDKNLQKEERVNHVDICTYGEVKDQEGIWRKRQADRRWTEEATKFYAAALKINALCCFIPTQIMPIPDIRCVLMAKNPGVTSIGAKLPW